MAGPAVDYHPPGFGRMATRGLFHRCPLCGGRPVVRRWFQVQDRCGRCGLTFDRESGAMIGGIGLNTVMSFGLLLVTMLSFFLATWPQLAVVPMMVTCGAVVVVVPFAFYPSSKLLWLAFDLRVNPLRPGEVNPGYGPEPSASPGDDPSSGASTGAR